MPRIHWYHPPRGGRGSESSTGAVVSHLPGTRAAVVQKANSLASEAWLQLLWHRQTGVASIKVVAPPATDLDAWVVLHDVDPGGNGIGGENKHKRSAMSIELGWHQNNAFGIEGREAGHPGLHILDGVMKRAINRYGGQQ